MNVQNTLFAVGLFFTVFRHTGGSPLDHCYETGGYLSYNYGEALCYVVAEGEGGSGALTGHLLHCLHEVCKRLILSII
jgi:hypothetical protein